MRITKSATLSSLLLAGCLLAQAQAGARAQDVVSQCISAQGAILNSDLCNCFNIARDPATNRYVARGNTQLCLARINEGRSTSTTTAPSTTGSISTGGGTVIGGNTGNTGGTTAATSGNPGNEPGISGPGTEVGKAGENPGGSKDSPTEAQGKGG